MFKGILYILYFYSKYRLSVIHSLHKYFSSIKYRPGNALGSEDSTEMASVPWYGIPSVLKADGHSSGGKVKIKHYQGFLSKIQVS